MSFDALQERLKQLEDTTAQLRELVSRLAGLSFVPGSVPLGATLAEDDNNAAAELGAEIAQVLREEEEDLELLREEVLDLRGGREGSRAEHDKRRLKEWVERLEAELKSSRLSFRKAQLSARDALAAAQRQERALVLSSYAHPPTQPPPTDLSDPDSPHPPAPHARRRRGADPPAPPASAEVSASRDVTAALRETHGLLVSEVSRSDFAARTLAESTAALGELGARYDSLGGQLRRAGGMVAALLRVQRSDTWYLTVTLYMLAGTAAWLVFRRLFYGPLLLLVWWPLRGVFRVGSGAVGMVGWKGGGGASMVVDSGDGKSRLVGIGEEGAVPTVAVEGGEAQDGHGGDPDSMVEKVGRIVDGNEGGHEHNPKKRMWEEDKEAAKQAERVRDEL